MFTAYFVVLNLYLLIHVSFEAIFHSKHVFWMPLQNIRSLCRFSRFRFSHNTNSNVYIVLFYVILFIKNTHTNIWVVKIIAHVFVRLFAGIVLKYTVYFALGRSIVSFYTLAINLADFYSAPFRFNQPPADKWLLAITNFALGSFVNGFTWVLFAAYMHLS